MKNLILSQKSSISSISNSTTTPSINQETDFQYLQNMVVRYVYQETSLLENSKVESVLQSNEKLNQFFYEIVSLKKQMDDCQTSQKPSSQTLEKILNYSKK
jgi:cysteinyl-tRNA synthetase